MIKDPLRLTDGFRGLPDGMNGANLPPLVDPTSVWYAENVTFRGGLGAKTRPGFLEIPSTFWRPALINGSSSTYEPVSDFDTQVINGVSTTSAQRYATYVSNGKYMQGAFMYQDPRVGNPAQIVLVIDGYIVALTLAERSCFVLNPTDPLTPQLQAYMTQAEQYLIIQSTADTPRIYDGYGLRKATDYGDGVNVVPIGKQMAYGQGRLFVATNEGSQIVAGDLIYGGSTQSVNIKTITPSDFPVLASISGTICTLTGANLPVSAGGRFWVSSDNSSDDTNKAIGTFLANSATSTSITYTIPSGTVLPSGNLTLSFGLQGYLVIGTEKEHGFSAGQIVTIQGSASSTTATGNLDGTFVVQQAPTTKTFTVAVDANGYGIGTGGTVALYNAGATTDLLNFSETNYLTGGGPISIPASLGRVVSMSFVPTQDTATGQGDLVVLCERGAASLSVYLDRATWQSTAGFQRILYQNIGAVSDSTKVVNGDLFFRSLDGNGIRSYRSARAEFSGYGQVPMSAEIDPILMQDTETLLGRVSFAFHDDRLFMTCWPTQTPTQVANDAAADAIKDIPLPIIYKGIAVLDFRSVANGHGNTKSAYEGVWSGLDVLKLLDGNDSGEKRAFIITKKATGFGLWEITPDLESDRAGDGTITPINSSIITRAYNFNKVMELKKLLRLDLWFDGISGGPNRSLNATVEYRPDDWPNWVQWGSITKTFNTESSPTSDSSTPYTYLPDGYSPQLRLPAPAFPSSATDSYANTDSLKPTLLGYDFNFRIKWSGTAKLGRMLVHALEIVEPVSGGSL